MLTGSSRSDYSSSDGSTSLTTGSVNIDLVPLPMPMVYCWCLIAVFAGIASGESTQDVSGSMSLCSGDGVSGAVGSSQLIREHVSKPNLETSYWHQAGQFSGTI